MVQQEQTGQASGVLEALSKAGLMGGASSGLGVPEGQLLHYCASPVSMLPLRGR